MSSKKYLTFTSISQAHFLGKILKAELDSITITNAFHNGMKMKKFTAEVTIGKDEIELIEFIKVAVPSEVARSVQSTPVTQPILEAPRPENKSYTTAPAKFNNKSPFVKPIKPAQNNQNGHDKQKQKTTKPIAILRKPAPSTSNNFMSSSVPQSFKPDNNMPNGITKKTKKHNIKNYDLMQPDDFESLEEDFDFEGNLALFDKKEIFKEIDNEHIFGIKGSQKPDLVRQLYKPEEKYRHDENVIESMLMQFKNVQLEFKPKQEYTTDEPGIGECKMREPHKNQIIINFKLFSSSRAVYTSVLAQSDTEPCM